MSDSFSDLRKKTCKTSTLVEWHTTRVLKVLKRKITGKHKYKHPWTVGIREVIHFEIFIEAFWAIRNFRSSFGVLTKVVGDKAGKLKSVVIKFVHLGAIIHHLTQLTNGSVKVSDYIKKKLEDGCVGNLLVSDKKTVTITYRRSTGVCQIHCN